MRMAWGARHVLGTAKGQCGWSRKSWVRRIRAFSGFFSLQTMKIFPKLLQWIKREGKKKNILANITVNIHSRAHFSHSWGGGVGGWGAKWSTLLRILYLSRFCLWFLLPKWWLQWPSPVQPFITSSSPPRGKWVPHPSRLRTWPENNMGWPCLACVPLLSKSLRCGVEKQSRGGCLDWQGQDPKPNPESPTMRSTAPRTQWEKEWVVILSKGRFRS